MPLSYERAFVISTLDRTRTGTPFTALDFKSNVSTIPPQGHKVDNSNYFKLSIPLKK